MTMQWFTFLSRYLMTTLYEIISTFSLTYLNFLGRQLLGNTLTFVWAKLKPAIYCDKLFSKSSRIIHLSLFIFQDVNDHSPVFTKSSYEVRLYENITVGGEVILVRATDEDSADNKVVEYSFADGSGVEHFYIDMNSGRVTVKNPIDRDPPLNQTMFNITVGFCPQKYWLKSLAR